MNTYPYDAVLFDLDGTLICSEPAITYCLRQAMDALGLEIPADADLRLAVGPSLTWSFTELLHIPQGRMAEAARVYREIFDREGIARCTVYPLLRSVLTMLNDENVYLAVATSRTGEVAEKMLQHFGLAHYFDRIVGEQDALTVLGKAEMIRRALPEKCERAVMVGDRFYDIEGAAERHIDSIGVEYGCGTEDELVQSGATHIVPDVEALRALLCPGGEIPRGAFISMEGLDGCGKTTQADLLEKSLRDYGFSVLRTREPGGCDISEEIRSLILSTEHMEMCDACEALLYAASRAQLVHQVIRPEVERGTLVLCDRFVDSSIAYQGGGRDMGMDEIAQINELAVDRMLPDATVYLAMEHEQAFARRYGSSELDRIEVESQAFRERTQRAYEKLAHDNRKRFVVVDGSRDVHSVARDVFRAVIQRLEPSISEEE